MTELSEPLMFDWDLGNSNKNFAKHDVNNLETEEVFTNNPVLILSDEKHSGVEERKLLLGITNNGRYLATIFTVRGSKIRVISARDMSKKERRFYEKTIREDSTI